MKENNNENSNMNNVEIMKIMNNNQENEK